MTLAVTIHYQQNAQYLVGPHDIVKARPRSCLYTSAPGDQLQQIASIIMRLHIASTGHFQDLVGSRGSLDSQTATHQGGHLLYWIIHLYSLNDSSRNHTYP